MSSTIEVYTFEDADGKFGTFRTTDYREALRYAQTYNLAIVAHQYEWVDSNLVEDYRPKRRKRSAPRGAPTPR